MTDTTTAPPLARIEAETDGLRLGEGAFLPCSFWLVHAYQLQGRDAEARALWDRLLALRNDVGLLSQEYDPRAGRQVGRFPQAYSHLAPVAAALSLDGYSLLRARIDPAALAPGAPQKA